MICFIGALSTSSRRLGVRAFNNSCRRSLLSPVASATAATTSGGYGAFSGFGLTTTATTASAAAATKLHRSNQLTLFSTAADNELETALDELLGEAMDEAEHPRFEEGEKGHVQGSREFPSGLVETVCGTFLFIFVVVVLVVLFVVDCLEINVCIMVGDDLIRIRLRNRCLFFSSSSVVKV